MSSAHVRAPSHSDLQRGLENYADRGEENCENPSTLDFDIVASDVSERAGIASRNARSLFCQCRQSRLSRRYGNAKIGKADCITSFRQMPSERFLPLIVC